MGNYWKKRFPGLETRANRYLPMLRRIVSANIAFISLVALLEVWGVDAIVWFYGGQIGSRLLSAIATIGIAALAAAATWEVSNALVDRQLNTLSREGHYARVSRDDVTFLLMGEGRPLTPRGGGR